MRLLDMVLACVNENLDATLASLLLVSKSILVHVVPWHGVWGHSPIAAGVTPVAMLPILEDLLLDDILFEYLVIEFEWLPVDQFVVKAFAVDWLNDVSLSVGGILLANAGHFLMFVSKPELLLHCVLVVLH